MGSVLSVGSLPFIGIYIRRTVEGTPHGASCDTGRKKTSQKTTDTSAVTAASTTWNLKPEDVKEAPVKTFTTERDASYHPYANLHDTGNCENDNDTSSSRKSNDIGIPAETADNDEDRQMRKASYEAALDQILQTIFDDDWVDIPCDCFSE